MCRLAYLSVVLSFFLVASGCQALIDATNTNTNARIDAEGPRYTVHVSAFAVSAPQPYSTFVVLPMDSTVASSDLEFLEYAGYVAKVLSARGLRRVERPAEAGLGVFLAYGIGEPKEQYYTRAVPVWGQTGVSSVTTSTYGNTSYSTVQPQYGVTGYRTEVESTTTYNRWALVQAVDVAAWRDRELWMEVWKARLTSTGSTADLRTVVPVLFAASIDLLGGNTGKSVQRVIAQEGTSVLWLRGRAAAPN